MIKKSINNTERVIDASPATLVSLLEESLLSPRKSQPIKVTKQEVYDFIKRQGVRIPNILIEYIDAIVSHIENPNSVSQAFYCESRRKVGQYIEVRDETSPLSGQLSGHKTRAGKFYELLDTFGRAK